MIKYDRFAGGKHFSVTFSYDDGNIADRRLCGIFDKYKLKATFNLISGRFGGDVVSEGEIKELYKNHEIAGHTVSHPHLSSLPPEAQLSEIFDCRRKLEDITGGFVRGMAYPYGEWDGTTVNAMKAAGISYSRTVNATKGFSSPSDFLFWNPTCHHSDALSCIERFKTNFTRSWCYGGLLYIWGHSFEFDRADNWDLAEKMCAEISGQPDVWYATCGEIYEYITARRRLCVSLDGKKIYNPSCISVFVSDNGRAVEIKPSETYISE